MGNCPEAVHPDAFGKDDFRRLVALGRSLGLEPIPLLQTFGHGDDPFLPDWASHLRNIVAMRRASEAPGVAGWCVTSWSVRHGLKRLQLPMLALDPEAAIAAAMPGLSPDAALRAISLAGATGVGLPTFLAQIWTRYKDSRLPPPGWLAGRLADPACAADAETLRQRMPELVAGLDEATATILAAVRATRGSGAEPPSFPALVLEGVALKRSMLSALGAALGIAGFQPPSPKALQSCLERTVHYYSIVMTPSTARCAAEIVWNPLIDYWS